MEMINIKINGDLLECVATDSYRLAKKNIKLSDFVNNPVDIVIPGRNINELEKLLTDEEDVSIHVFNNKVLFNYKNIYFVPYGQDSFAGKPNSMVADFSLIPDTLQHALNGIQVQPVILTPK